MPKLDSSKGKVLVMCLADPSANPRPMRAIELCNSAGYKVDVVGFPPEGTIACNRYFTISAPQIPTSRLLKLFRKFRIMLGLLMGRLLPIEKFRNYLNKIRYNSSTLDSILVDHNYDILLVEDLHLLPQAILAKRGSKVLFDAREYYPRQRDEELLFRLFDKPDRLRICNNYLSLCDAVITVSKGLAEEYKKEFGIFPEVVKSLPFYVDCETKPVQSDKIKMVHHGIANRDRKLENMIEVMDGLDSRFSLDFYLTHHHDYISELRKLAENNPRIQFKEPVPFHKIIPMLNQYDIGFYYLEPSSFNLKHSLPNKFFEFIQARLTVAIGPSPEMASYVKEYDCGVIADDFSISSMVETLNNLDEKEVFKFKLNSDEAARQLCYERESKKLESIINQLL